MQQNKKQHHRERRFSGLKLWITLTHDELTLFDLITEYVGCQSINCVFTVSGFCSVNLWWFGGEEQAERKGH